MDLTPKAEESLHKIMMNIRPVDETASVWAGTFVCPGVPLHGYYDWVRYIAGEDCSLAEDPATPPPLPEGDADDIHVEDFALQLNRRGTQAIASAAVISGIGEAVAMSRYPERGPG